MAKILTIEIDTAEIRVAEVDSRGQHIYRCFVLPVPQGAVDDGQIRDTKSLGKLLKEELIAQGIKTSTRCPLTRRRCVLTAYGVQVTSVT